jgi:TonB family protein
MKIPAAILAIPVGLAIAAASAGAATFTLAPLGAAHHEQIAALGATCAVPYAPAKMKEAFLDYPAIAEDMRVEGVAKVGISLSEDGKVSRAWPIQSTGNAVLDRAAIEAAKGGSYDAERSQCQAVGGDYQLEVNFSLDQ